MNTNKVVEVFFGCDMRCGHKGLALRAKEKDIDVERLQPGQHVMFMNSDRTAVKTFSAHNVICYMKLPKNRPLSMDTLKFLPQAFSTSGEFDYKKALKASLEKRLAAKRG